MLGKPREKDTAFRPFTFTKRLVCDDQAVWFHVLTREMLAVPLSEENAPETEDWLKRHWFLVPEETEDFRIARQARSVTRLMNRRPREIRSFVIFTTTDCNARCFYCFEKGCRRVPMSLETADAVAAYIERRAKGHKARIQWFGGEPLYNIPVIDRICERLRGDGMEYASTAVSNGFFFDDGNVQKAIELWNLKWVQITLDGTEAIYNRAKAYIHKGFNAYQRVKANIGRLLEAGIRVTVRLNIDRYNAEDLLALVDELADAYGDKQGFSVYSHTLFEEGIPEDQIEARRPIVFALQQTLEERIRARGLHAPRRPDRGLSLNRCMADSGRSVTILPDGRTGLCEHFTDSELVGNIWSDEEDAAMIARWREEPEDIPACASCICYPQCNRLAHCPDETACFPELQAQRIGELLEAIQNEYDLWKKNANDEPDEEEHEEENC